ncbi:hypothetical protein EHS13_34520 [Paenibacillus psychroresistens]|uniref:HTH luxR-type domain-containing protein n=1 Tax=Paenibacillus psychroresistens TaxID=1778678 RepID=A0A6B8RX76_9BACL|nr:LuxR C-terminal-related transcriptional regulator [Paenibacillus psychroresistens]QGQ99618.1 hypothetical protein EHS13_34520 [Paenibacillus psychroresistens]
MLLNNKLLIPRVHPSIIKRSSLLDNLNIGLTRKLTLVTAQAGYGKTTILSEWAKQSKARIVWLSLDKHDNDFIPFWSYVLTGFELIKPDFAVNLWPILLNFSTKSIEVFTTSLLHELQALEENWVIILDDFHFVDHDLINDSITMLLENLPPLIHIYISSRSKPSFPATRLFAKKELHQINVQDLRFQLADSTHFFKLRSELNLSKKEISQLVDRSEGWINGLQLAALSMEKTKNQAQFIRQFSGKHRDISNYLIEEVFQQQSVEMRDFLLKTSVLSEMNHSLCEAVTQQKNCQDKLESLEKLNLLIVPLDDNRVWYRYHQLFSEFLQHTLEQKYHDQWLEAHMNAAHWLESNGFQEAAVDHFLAAKQYTEAIRLIELLLPQTHHSKWNVLHRWLTALPDETIIGKPMIDIYYIGALIGVGEWSMALERTKQAELRILAIKDYLSEPEWNQLGGTLYFFGAITASDQKDHVRSLHYFEMYDSLMPEGNSFQMIGGNSYGGTDHDDVLLLVNDLHVADSYINNRVQAWGMKQHYPAIGYFLTSQSDLLYEWNRLDEAKEIAERTLMRKDIQPYARLLIACTTVLAKIEQAQGHPERANQLLEQIKQQIQSSEQAAFLLRIEAFQLQLVLQQDPSASASAWLEKSDFDYKDPITSYPFKEYHVFAEVLAHTGQTSEALELLERMYQFANREGRIRNKIKVRISQSVILYELGKTNEAFVFLLEALRLAEPQGYIRSFIDRGPTLAAMLYLLINTPNLIPKKAPVDYLPYIKQLLRAYKGDLPELATSKLKLTEQESRILKQIEQGLSNKQIAEQVFITAETVKSHIKKIYKKLEVNNRVQAVQAAKEQNLL